MLTCRSSIASVCTCASSLPCIVYGIWLRSSLALSFSRAGARENSDKPNRRVQVCPRYVPLQGGLLIGFIKVLDVVRDAPDSALGREKKVIALINATGWVLYVRRTRSVLVNLGALDMY